MEMERKLKILCLHGYRQYQDKFRVQTGGVRKFLKSQADFHFVSAPHLLKGVEDEQRGWWFSKIDSFSSKDETDSDTGFNETLTFIKEIFDKEGPFDGIFGFSQGAALAAILCSLQQRQELAINFKFVIIVSGFKSKCSKHSKYYSERISIPSLHVIGENDDVVDKSFSEQLAELFVEPVIIKHSGGHHVPTSNLLKQPYRDFVTAQRQALLAAAV